ncbi:hypothetical protein Tco_1086346 [Tanacetum coccineum]
MASLSSSFEFPFTRLKKCSIVENLTQDCGCLKGSLEDKILVPVPDLSQRPLKIEKMCLDCGDPVHGLYCRQCALIRKTLEEVFQDFQGTLPSRHMEVLNFVIPEPFIVKQGPGVNSSQNPPQINHNCCYECGDSLDDIFCQRCTCKVMWKVLILVYKCPPQIRLSLKPEPCNLGTCQKCGCNEYDGVCFYCKVGNGTPSNFSTPYSSNDSPSVANHPPQPQYVPYSFIQKKEEEKRIAEEQAAKDRYWKIPICYDDDEDDTIAITPVLPIEEPDNSLSIGNVHLDTVPATESDEVIKSSVEDLVPISSESEGVPKICDVPLCENTTSLNALKEHSETIINSNNDYSSSEDNSYENIDYVNASTPDAEIVSLEVVEIVVPEVGGIDTDILLTIFFVKNC